MVATVEPPPGTYPAPQNRPTFDATDAGWPQHRPRQVTIASVVLVVIGLLGLLVAWFLLYMLSDMADHGESVNPALYALSYGQFALSGTQIVSGVFVWQGRQWARRLAIVICAVNLLGGVISLFSGAELQAIFGLAMNISLIRILTHDDVSDWCR